MTYQAYDNASTMAGIHSGVQCRIKQLNSKAIFSLCANHSLNLTGVHTVASSKHSATFFAVVATLLFLLLLKDVKCYACTNCGKKSD